LLKEPPEPPLPDPVECLEFYGETYVRYPLSPAGVPTYHTLLFKAKADLWIIMNELSLVQMGESVVPRNLPIGQVLEFYKRLRGWFHKLPRPLSPGRIVMPHQVKLHMHYNILLIAMLKPILNDA
jgi:hypothetical protein